MNKKEYEKKLEETLEEVKKDIYLIKSKFSVVNQVNTLFKNHPVTMTAICVLIGIYFSRKRSLRSILKLSSLFSVEKLLEHTIKKNICRTLSKKTL